MFHNFKLRKRDMAKFKKFIKVKDGITLNIFNNPSYSIASKFM